MREKVFLSRIKPVPLPMRTANDRGIAWRKMADFVALVADFVAALPVIFIECLVSAVAENGGFCRGRAWRIMADFVDEYPLY